MATDTGFGVALRIYRVAAGLSQNALARAAGIDPAYVNRFERVGTGQPSRPIALALASALQLDAYQTDRLLYAAGLAPVNDWQTLALDYARLLTAIRLHLDDLGEMPALPDRGGKRGLLAG